METKENKGNDGLKEVDIFFVFRAIGGVIGRFFLGILMGIAKIRKTIVDHARTFIFFSLIGLGIGVLHYSWYFKKQYSGAFVIQCRYLDVGLAKSLVDNLNQLCEDEGRPALAQALGIPLEVSQNIHGIEITEFEDTDDVLAAKLLKEQLMNEMSRLRGKQNFVEGDEINRKMLDQVVQQLDEAFKQSFKIRVVVYNDPVIFGLLEEKLVAFIRGNSNIARRISARRDRLMEEQRLLIQETQSIDTLRNLLFRNLRNGEGFLNSGTANNYIVGDRYILNPMDIYRIDIEIKDRINEIKEDLAVEPDFEVLSRVMPSGEPVSISLGVLLASWVTGSVIFLLVLFQLRKFNAHLKQLTAGS